MLKILLVATAQEEYKDKKLYFKAPSNRRLILGDNMARKIVDIHAHAFDEKIAIKATENLHEYYGISPAADGRLIHLIESSKENNIDKLVVCATATKPAQVKMINNYVSTSIGKHIIGFGTLHPDFDNLDLEIERMIKLGLSGIKLHPIFQGFEIDEEKALKMFECVGSKLPVLIHLGDKNSDAASPKRLSRVMEKYPEITFIGAHLGGYSEWEEAKECLFGKNLYIDTSSSTRFLKPKIARELIRLHGVDKVLFGTDYPLSNHAFEIKCLEKLKLTDEEYEKIYWKNAYNLLGLK